MAAAVERGPVRACLHETVAIADTARRSCTVFEVCPGNQMTLRKNVARKRYLLSSQSCTFSQNILKVFLFSSVIMFKIRENSSDLHKSTKCEIKAESHINPHCRRLPKAIFVNNPTLFSGFCFSFLFWSTSIVYWLHFYSTHYSHQCLLINYVLPHGWWIINN